MSNFKGKASSAIDLPKGWVLITENFLAPFREEELTLDEAVAYFDGLSPTWKEALSGRVPQRTLVRELESSLDEARRVKRRQVTLLVGAGGEGKSTTIRQIVSNLSKSGSFQNLLWHEDVNSPLEKSFINDLISTRESWLIISDEADRICKDVFDAVCLLHEKAKNNVQFLLCCRDTDWRGERADVLSWNEHAYLVTRLIRGLTLEDANLVVEAWGYYGDRGLGKLSGIDLFEAASRLVELARSEALNNSSEGSFLGAMLRVRVGEAIQDHVKSLLVRLDSREAHAGGFTLMDAFAYIIALHAENILLLTESVLARTIGCPPEQLQRRVLGPLGEEAAISTHSAYVLTRHRAIAEVAKDILTKVFNIDFDGIYKKLIRAALETFYEGELEIDPKPWNQMPRVFFDRGNQKLGIKLARVLVEVEPEDPFPVCNLAKLHRRARQPELAVKAFRDSIAKVNPDIAYYHEWSTSESYNDNPFNSAWLDGIALCDESADKKSYRFEIPLCLSGLASSFIKLFDRTADRRFIEACGAATQLGLQSNPDDRAASNLHSDEAKSRKAGVGAVNNEVAFQRVVTGIRLAWELRPEEDDLPATVKAATHLTFKILAARLKVQRNSNE